MAGQTLPDTSAWTEQMWEQFEKENYTDDGNWIFILEDVLEDIMEKWMFGSLVIFVGGVFLVYKLGNMYFTSKSKK